MGLRVSRCSRWKALRSWFASLPLAAVFGLCGCGGVQSALAPAGRDAERIAVLFWWMTAGALVVWAAMIAIALHYSRRSPAQRNHRRDRTLIIGGGVLVPTVTLTALLVYGLAMLPDAVSRAPDGSLLVDVLGEQWWWRVRYEHPAGRSVELANELRLPVGRPVQLRLHSDNVIHSFWVPSLAGKMDMIPGRVTYLTIRPTSTGVFRGACAEYCGTSHALMAFFTEVVSGPAFDRWLDEQARPAGAPMEALTSRGADGFLAHGCAACHTIRGTSADGVIGPDLTHVGSRLSLGAGILDNDAAAFRRWIAGTEHVKPGVHMPAFGMLPEEELRALTAYLEWLQ
ncbi:MAG: cytochrome c oxidase subunit II [Vicinamibacterales bacterium]